MNKRIFSFSLALCMLLALAAPAFAQQEPEPTPEPEYRLVKAVSTTPDYTEETTFSYDNGGYLPTGVTVGGDAETLTYDEAGRLVSVSSSWFTRTYTYDASGNMLEDHETDYDDPNTVSFDTVNTRTYDDNGNVLTVDRKYAFYDDLSTYHAEYTYDDDGNLITLLSTNDNGTSVTEYTYNENGDTASSTLTNTDAAGAETVSTTTYEYVYDDKGNMTSRTTTSDDGTTEETTYSYDEQGRQIGIDSADSAEKIYFQPLLSASWDRSQWFTLNEDGSWGDSHEECVISLALNDNAGTVISSWRLTTAEPVLEYDANGYLTRVDGGEGGTLEFTYEPVT